MIFYVSIITQRGNTSMKVLKILIIFTFILYTIAPVSANQAENNEAQIKYLNLKWWEKFGDENLNNYLILMYQNNQDLKISSYETKQAQQVVKTAFSNQLPQLTFSPQINREFTSSDIWFGDVLIPDYAQNRFFLPVSMTYEADIWGENYLRTKSTKEKLSMVEQEERASYILMTTSLASDYYNLIKIDKLLENQQKLIELQGKISELYNIKYDGGLCSITEVLNEKQLLALYQEDYNNLKEKQDILENQIKVILGDRNFGEINRTSYEDINIIELPENIDTEVIQNRPDVKKAEAYIRKIGIDVKVARREFLPKFLVFGQVGFNAYSLSKLFGTNSFLANAGILPSFDIFSGGRKMAMLKYQKLAYEKALQVYEKTLLTSIQELNDSMVSLKTSRSNLLASKERFKIEQEKYNLKVQKVNIGAASNLELLECEKTLILSEEANISNEINTIIAAISVYKAVGGKDYTDNL